MITPQYDRRYVPTRGLYRFGRRKSITSRASVSAEVSELPGLTSSEAAAMIESMRTTESGRSAVVEAGLDSGLDTAEESAAWSTDMDTVMSEDA